MRKRKMMGNIPDKWRSTVVYKTKDGTLVKGKNNTKRIWLKDTWKTRKRKMFKHKYTKQRGDLYKKYDS